MKLSHSNIKHIKKWLEQEQLEVSFDIDFILQVYKQVFLPKFAVGKTLSLESRFRAAKAQVWFIALNLLIIQHMNNNRSAKDIKQGFVYVVTNPAWPDYVKIGSAFNTFDRLKAYQTSSPLRDYKMVRSVFVEDRVAYEKALHAKFECTGEWAKVPVNAVLNEFKLIENQFDEKIREFCKAELVEHLQRSDVVLNEASNTRKLFKAWLVSKHLIAEHWPKDKLDEISKFLHNNKSWRLCHKDVKKDSVVYKSTKYKVRGEVFKDKVVMRVL